MRRLFAVIPAVILFSFFLSCEKKSHPREKAFHEPVAKLYDSTLKPFYHGVASGDPLADRVIIWTRVTPQDSITEIKVRWEISENENFNPIHSSDSVLTNLERDYTVKVDVPHLQPGKFYYYRFIALGKTSIVGRTKTSSLEPDSLKFAVVSCNNWEFGYFNAYENIANKNVDAVIHLGDYIYEYATGKYGDTTIGRINIPTHEVITLQDYRTRYSQYHLDDGLRHARQMHPFITIWDDHEVANNVYTEGAQNHQQDEGDFDKRKEAAKQAYYEWIPIRESGKHYRKFSYGKLADLVMLDERLEGRTKPVDSVSSKDYNDTGRTMLGNVQHAWLEDALLKSKSTWKIIGNQVIFSDVNASPTYRGSGVNLDAWDGYPDEKKRIIKLLRENNMRNVIFITGDTHASWAIEAATETAKTYNVKNSAGAFAIELGTTSVSSGNGDEYGVNPDSVIKKEQALLKVNPHVKYLNNRDHGYMLVTLFPTYTKSEWWYVKTLRNKSDDERLGKSFEIKTGSYSLR
jgi:alkaline phosphatase D